MKRESWGRVSCGRLPNGFAFFTKYDSRAHISGVGFRAGSLHTPLGRVGIPHLNEHLSADYTDDEELRLEEYGCGPDEDINIRIDLASTFYGHDYVNTQEMMRDMFSNIIVPKLKDPDFREEKLRVEKAAVDKEYFWSGMDEPKDRLRDFIYASLYRRNPARIRIDCEPDDLRLTNLDDVRQFYDLYYGANNAFAIIFSMPHRKVKRLVEEYFGDWRQVPAPLPPYDLSESRPVLSGIVSCNAKRRGIGLRYVAVAFPTNPYGHKDDIAIDLLSHILRFRLRQRLRFQNEDIEGGAYRVYVDVDRSFAHGVIYVSFATRSAEFAKRGEDIIVEECERLKREDTDQNLLVGMSNKLYNRHVGDFTINANGLAESVIQAYCNGDEELRGLNSYVGRLSRVGPRTIRRVANEYFTTPNRYVRVVMEPFDDGIPDERVSVSFPVNGEAKPPEPSGTLEDILVERSETNGWDNEGGSNVGQKA